MRTTNLMLGDIITFKDSVETDQTPVPVKVIALGYQHRGNENEALVQIGNDETCDIVTIDDDFTDYPLTPEILEKNGFESDTNMFGLCDYELSESYILENRGDRFCFVKRITGHRSTFHIIDIKCVHELQHALRLCGIEKEIKL